MCNRSARSRSHIELQGYCPVPLTSSFHGPVLSAILSLLALSLPVVSSSNCRRGRREPACSEFVELPRDSVDSFTAPGMILRATVSRDKTGCRGVEERLMQKVGTGRGHRASPHVGVPNGGSAPSAAAEARVLTALRPTNSIRHADESAVLRPCSSARPESSTQSSQPARRALSGVGSASNWEYAGRHSANCATG